MSNITGISDLIDQRFTRNSQLMDGINKAHIHILGVGSIGSLASLCFAKNGFLNQTLYDIDTVDINNIGPQIYGPKQIGKDKTDAMVQVINTLVGENNVKGEYWKIGENYEEDKAILQDIENLSVNGKGLIVIAVDCMEVRKKVFDTISESCLLIPFIDARMSIGFLQLYSNDGESTIADEAYAKTLFSNEDAVPTPCTDKATAFTSFIAGGVIVAEAINMLKRIKDNKGSEKDTITSICYDIRTHDLFKQELQ